jgi:peptidoglycan/LPS O-acetylase OafA/YrhL
MAVDAGAVALYGAVSADSRTPSRIDALDGLRGLAALLVVFQHVAEGIIKMHTMPPEFERAGRLLLGETFNFGRFGVALFFLLSGFVIPFSFRTDRPLLGFVISRVFRLYPAYWLSLGFALLVLPAIGAQVPAPRVIAANLTMMQKYLGQPDVVAAYWTLATELAFYVMAAGLFVAGWLRMPRVLAGGTATLLAAALLLALVSPLLGRRLPADLPLHLGLMLLGTIVRLAMLDGDPMARRLGRRLFVAFLIVAPVVQFMTLPPGDADGFTRPLAPTLGYVGALLVFFALADRRAGFGRVATWSGAVSYSIYLFHGTIVMALEPMLVAGRPGLALLYAGSVVCGTIIIAAIVYHGVERPMVRLGHRVMGRSYSATRRAGQPAIKASSPSPSP